MDGSVKNNILNAGGDLRYFIEILDELGELKTIKGADWNCEIGAK